MKKFIRHIIFYGLAIYLTSQIISGLSISQGLDSLFFAAIILALSHALIEPVINIFLMPLNVLTLGMLTSVATIVSVFILTKIYHNVDVHPFKFPGISFYGVEIKPFSAGVLLSYIIVSVIIFVIVRFLKWVSEE